MLFTKFRVYKLVYLDKFNGSGHKTEGYLWNYWFFWFSQKITL